MFLRTFALLVALAFSGISYGSATADVALAPAGLNAKDLKAIGYVENAHGQLDEWSNRFTARLERGLGPREPDPVLDGRARYQLMKLRETYAPYSHNEKLQELINKLADAHERRLDAITEMSAEGVDRSHYLAVSNEVDLLIQAIRLWSKKR